VRNITLYAATAALLYMSAPILYVGIVQASLCHSLGASDTVANLPLTAFYCALATPPLIAWQFHTVGAIKPVLISSYSMAALAGLIVATLLLMPVDSVVQLTAVVFHGACMGATTGVAGVFIWEVVNLGIAPKHRGLTYALAYGAGPLFAVAGSVAAQHILSGNLHLSWPWMQNEGTAATARYSLSFPANFAVLFAATVPLMGTAAILASRYRLPVPGATVLPRTPLIASLWKTSKQIFHDDVLRRTFTAYVLVVAGSSVITIMSLYTEEAMGRLPEEYVGYQSAIEFAFKMVAGLFLGWLFTRTNPKTGLIVPTALCLCGVLWVLWLPHFLFLAAFGFMGAGDLYAVYFPNYILVRSARDRVRHNIAFLQLVSLPVSAAPTALGAISDAFGKRTSFVTAAFVLTAALTVIIASPPLDPTPLEEAG